MTADATRARSFDAFAGDYDRFRPSYPDALWTMIQFRLRLPARPHVADLGAGTGRASLAMAARGWRVTAVDPSGPMLDVLRARASDEGSVVATVRAPAEATGLAPSSVDLATAGQAFHWFDGPSALREMARIVRPGGGIALFWNVRDVERSAFLADYALLIRPFSGGVDTRPAGPRDETRRAIAGVGAFEEPAFEQLTHEVPMTPDGFVGLAFTASYVRAGLVPEDQESFRAALVGLLERHGLAGRRSFSVPYRTDLWTARRSER